MGYFVVVGDLSIVEGYWLVERYAWFLFGHLRDEPEKNIRCPAFVNRTLALSSSFG